ncbi:Lrp/AsnC family transcriptional regulator [Gloeocapsopsis crepidinum LEGE 06123]|uniref:Lrp/AsnC family transcriptional regulator n=1 Tax=Gloeocapsopsis crepidinum LEGE 06123 TaxID=588587 RepID=A0ABR9UYV0_9CHRO|nr:MULTISPECIES: Lrp/AsnC family transcriptional regulator [Gloeocapsopsis]MBE9193500.1 Lrp/AsnC family transcriptional regulator [Gloeocapsopsis crepidinum LEGE 06123]PIG91215.1 AsnC family transcriptional regulator [Gloeocapsopsis sp. IPPAS B-1203]
MKKVKLDTTDVKLLHLLEVDARASIADLARALNMSAPSVSDRLRRLEESGVLQGFTIKIEPKILGYSLAFYIRIRPLPGQLSKIVSLIIEIEEVVECDRITGDDCFIAKAYVKSADDLERIIDQLIPYAQTNTSMIQSSPVKRRLPRLDEYIS